MRTSNPVLNEEVFARGIAGADRMTINGTVNKTGILSILVFVAASFTWEQAMQSVSPGMNIWMIGGAIGGLVVALITSFKPEIAKFTAPVYALLEGLFLGGISAFAELRFPGIAFQAILGTVCTLAALLLVYKSGMIKVTQNFRMGVMAATGGIFLVYMASMVMGFFGMSIPLIHGSGMVGIGFSLVVIAIAALNLVLDFDFIENGERMGAPKYMEWYAAFGLLVTLVWLYIEILRLLMKLSSRD